MAGLRSESTLSGSGDERGAAFPEEVRAMGQIVVGIDGSSCSRHALRFAADEARLRGESLRVVSAWQVPVAVYMGSNIAPVLDPAGFSALAREGAEKEIAEVLGSQTDPSVELTMREGNAAKILVEESDTASMLVVGSRGRGGFAGLLLGSVSQQCVAHAQCPVTVVHQSDHA
jgi:nucleotide-binding universal stress UspA family protein